MFPIIKTLSYVRKFKTNIVQNAVKNKVNQTNKHKIKRTMCTEKKPPNTEYNSNKEEEYELISYIEGFSTALVFSGLIMLASSNKNKKN